MYLSIDPGEHNRAGGSTGYAIFADDGEIIRFGQIKNEEITTFISEHIRPDKNDCKAVICEDFSNFVWKKSHQRSRKNATSVAIGRIEAVCELHNVPLHKQPSSVLNIGYKWGNIKPPSNHDISHQYSALAHGIYWLQSNGIVKPGFYMPDKDK